MPDCNQLGRLGDEEFPVAKVDADERLSVAALQSELHAMAEIVDVIGPLSNGARARVMGWALLAFDLSDQQKMWMEAREP